MTSTWQRPLLLPTLLAVASIGLAGCMQSSNAPAQSRSAADAAVQACAEWDTFKATATEDTDPQESLNRILNPAHEAANDAAYREIFAAGMALQVAYLQQDENAGILAMARLDVACDESL